jgi:hypothetical protein
MTEPKRHEETAPGTAPADSGEPVIVYNPVAARRWLLGGAADEYGIDEMFSAIELSAVAGLEELLAALGYNAVSGVWAIRLLLTNVLIWRTADGDGVDGGGIVTADLAISGQPIRLATHHQGFDAFTQRRETSGIDAAVEALGHVAGLVNTEVDLLRRALTPQGVYTVLGVWQDDNPIPVGVIAGQHAVTGGAYRQFEQGLWATSVEAPDVDTAERLAVEEMQAD